MTLPPKYAVFWFRRDLRLQDNVGLYHALKESTEQGLVLLPIFIFDTTILTHLESKDARVTFIHDRVHSLKQELWQYRADLLVFHHTPLEVFGQLIDRYEVAKVYANRDYEPLALARDKAINTLLQSKGIQFDTFKDHVIFEPHEILKDNQTPYQIYTPYSKRWLQLLTPQHTLAYPFMFTDCLFRPECASPLVELAQMGFERSHLMVSSPSLDKEQIHSYHLTRNQLDLEQGTTKVSVHLRFGTISIRSLVREFRTINDVFLKELIWREFFQMIIFHFPQNTHKAFNPQYDYSLPWNERVASHFEKWCRGETGFLLIDAAMHELNQTGYMHNRTRMLVANFLCKILHIDWRLGEAYFAKQLLDFELASNNGNWQWAAGCGCDAAPYFRIFNPELQAAKFDPQNQYIHKWLGIKLSKTYPAPIVDFRVQREVYLETMKARQ